MSDGGAESPTPADDPPPRALPAGPRPDGSAWGINWWGFVPLAIIAAAAFVGFRAIGFGGDDASAGVATTTTVARPTTAAPRPTTTSSTTTTSTTTTTTLPPTTVPAGPAVHAFGEVKPCRFGDACLVVSFTVSGFPEPLPTSFLCVYPNSQREFSFDGFGKNEACLTGDEGDVVYIEVAGIRSAPVSETNLNA